MTTTTATVTVLPIEPAVLTRFRSEGDGLGNRVESYAADGGEPLRCCLRHAHPCEQIALVSYSPTPVRGRWSEFGPVFVHAERCAGYTDRVELPADLRTGPHVLRAYRADGSMNYDANTMVDDGVDVEDVLRLMLGRDDVCEVHVRTLVPQCFLFAVR